ncbi:MAG: double zinc ribbon domain-containing protein [Desulfitobacteriia bacterium]
MPGYKHPCRYCDQFIPPDSRTCPFCGRTNPLGPLRCPKCKSPIMLGAKNCSSCGLSLQVKCPKCGKITFFGDYCEHCDSRLVVVCPNKKCSLEQPPFSEYCMKCKTKLF